MANIQGAARMSINLQFNINVYVIIVYELPAVGEGVNMGNMQTVARQGVEG